MTKNMKPASELTIGTEFYKGSYWRRVVGIQVTDSAVRVLALNWYERPRTGYPARLTFALDELVEVRS